MHGKEYKNVMIKEVAESSARRQMLETGECQLSSEFSTTDLDALIDQAVEETVTDRDAAAAKYIEAQKIVADQAYLLNLYDQMHTYVISNDIQGVEENPSYSYAIQYYNVTRK